MKVKDLLESKGSSVETIDSTAALSEAIRRLATFGVGALVVSDAGTTVDGIISERDVVRIVAAEGEDALGWKVADVMTAPVTTCALGDEVVGIMSLMTDRRIRHVPVVEDGALVGIVSIGDVVKSRVDELERDRKELLEYVSAR